MEREMGTGLVSWVRRQKKVELRGCVTPTREDHGFVALLLHLRYR